MSIAPDWYLDPTNRHERRYWDGSRWTDQVRDGSTIATDPVDAGPRVELQPLESDSSLVSSVPAPATTSVATGSAGTDQDVDADEPRPWAGGGYDAFARSAGLTAADSRPRYAHALARGALVVALLSLFASLTVVLGLVGVIGGLVAVIVGLRARQRLVDLGDTDQTTAVRAALLGMLTAMVGTLATVLLVALWADGEAIRFVACTEQTGVSDCVGDLVREVGGRLSP